MPGAPVELRDLALDPDRPHPVDLVGDLDGEQPHRPRLLGGGVGRLLRQCCGLVTAVTVGGARTAVR